MTRYTKSTQLFANLTGVEDLVAVGRLDLLGDLVLEVLDDERVRAVEHGEPVARHPHRGQPGRPLALGRVGRTAAAAVLALGVRLAA